MINKAQSTSIWGAVCLKTIKLSIFIFRDRFLVNVSMFSRFVYNLAETTDFGTKV